jgi:hypothetical protein
MVLVLYAPMAKWAARGDRERTRDKDSGLTRVLREAAGLVGQEPVHTTEGDVFDNARALAVAMVSLHPALRAAGVQLPR